MSSTTHSPQQSKYSQKNKSTLVNRCVGLLQAMPKDASLDLFLGLNGVWCPAAALHRPRRFVDDTIDLALAAAVAFAGAALVRRRHKHEARKAVAAAGLDTISFERGTVEQPCCCDALAVAVLEARGGDALRAYGRQLRQARSSAAKRRWQAQRRSEHGSDARGNCVAKSRRRAWRIGLPPPPRGRSSRRSRTSASSPRSRSRSPSCRSTGRLVPRWTIALAVAGGAFHVLAARRMPLSVKPLIRLGGWAFTSLGLSDGGDVDGAMTIAWAPLGSVALADARKWQGGAPQFYRPAEVSWDHRPRHGARWRSARSRATPSARRRLRRWPAFTAYFNRAPDALGSQFCANQLRRACGRNRSFIMFSNLRIEGHL